MLEEYLKTTLSNTNFAEERLGALEEAVANYQNVKNEEQVSEKPNLRSDWNAIGRNIGVGFFVAMGPSFLTIIITIFLLAIFTSLTSLGPGLVLAIVFGALFGVVSLSVFITHLYYQSKTAHIKNEITTLLASETEGDKNYKEMTNKIRELDDRPGFNLILEIIADALESPKINFATDPLQRGSHQTPDNPDGKFYFGSLFETSDSSKQSPVDKAVEKIIAVSAQAGLLLDKRDFAINHKGKLTYYLSYDTLTEENKCYQDIKFFRYVIQTAFDKASPPCSIKRGRKEEGALILTFSTEDVDKILKSTPNVSEFVPRVHAFQFGKTIEELGNKELRNDGLTVPTYITSQGDLIVTALPNSSSEVECDNIPDKVTELKNTIQQRFFNGSEIIQQDSATLTIKSKDIEKLFSTDSSSTLSFNPH